MAVPGTFFVPLLLFLCGPGPYPAAAHSHPGKGAHGKATGPFCGWSWRMELPSDGGRGGQDVGLRGLARYCGTRQGPCDPPMCPRTCDTYMGPCSGAARRVRLYQGALLGGVLAPTAVLEHF